MGLICDGRWENGSPALLVNVPVTQGVSPEDRGPIPEPDPEPAPALASPLFLLPAGFLLDRLFLDGDTIIPHLTVVSPTASCPDCGLPSRCVHSYYLRQFADLPS